MGENSIEFRNINGAEKSSESSRTNPFKGQPHHSKKHPPRTSGGKFYYSDWTNKPCKNTALPAIESVDLRHTPNSLEGCFLLTKLEVKKHKKFIEENVNTKCNSVSSSNTRKFIEENVHIEMQKNIKSPVVLSTGTHGLLVTNDCSRLEGRKTRKTMSGAS
ncbi:hypothetical protein TNCV_1341901 [Trichonephila clavipes]|uniref:Uncharacterized protein n=1 Tax=Trichonephila clavipes TaxID=2585209 RepID=A0A8X6RQW3_TRICX|nr:hypothetical protein TNCV_1341901 [Trichonephila clavipes]